MVVCNPDCSAASCLKRSGLLISVVAIAVTGCSVPREALPSLAAAQPVPERWAVAETSGAEIPLERYWTMLGDPLVDEYVARAQERNLDLAQAVTRLRTARAGLRQARADRVPRVTGSGGGRREFGDFVGNDVLLSLGADASWDADLFGRIDASVDAARSDIRAAGYSLADVERVIVAQVASQTVTARALAAQLAIARDTLSNQDVNLQIAKWRNQAGLVSSLDVEQARSQRAQTAAAIPQLEGDLVAAANVISTLIGEPPGEVYRAFTGAPRGVPVPPERVGLSAPADMLRRRPDVSAAEARLAADLDRVGVARAQLYPLLRLTGSVGTSAVDVGGLFEIVSGNVFAGLTQLLFDGGRARGQIEAAKAIADGSLAVWRQSILTALEEVESAAVDLEASNARVLALLEASDGARNAAILARSQYQAGVIDFQTLLVAESQLLNARTTQVSAESGRAIAFISLARALGGGWTAPGDTTANAVSVKGSAQ